MKTTTTIKGKLSIFSLILSLVLVFSCKEAPKVSIAKLLPRNEKIMNGKEWDFVQSYYQEMSLKIQKNDHDNDSKIKLAQLFVKEARVTGEHGHYYPAAIKLSDEVIADEKKNTDLVFNAMVTKAGVQLSHHDFSAALETGKLALKLNPFNAQLFGVLVDAHVELGQYKEAVEMADRMMAIRPDLRSYSRVSYLREIHGDVQGAKDAMLLAINAGYPGYEETAWAMHTYGEMLVRYNELDKATQVYETILKERENYPFAVAALAEIAIKKGDKSKGEGLLKQAIDIIPEVGYYISLAELYKEQNRKEELEFKKSEILKMLKEDEASGHNMDLEYAYVYQNLFGDLEKAKIYTQKELTKRPNNIDVNRTMALILKENKEIEEAKKCIAIASSTDSKHPDLIKLKI
jgi:tetratricopeptide (TPR) repeat protein